MAKTYRKPGHTITLVAPSGGVTNGVALLVGSKMVVPQSTAAEGVSYEGVISGIHKYKKKGSQAWAELEALYWDATNGEFTTDAAGGTNKAAGAAAAAVGNGAGETVGYVLLNGLPGCGCCC